MKHIIAIIAVVTLSACTTSQHTMKNAKTGQVHVCGENDTVARAFGAIGYAIHEQNAKKCKEAYEKQGFEVVK